MNTEELKRKIDHVFSDLKSIINSFENGSISAKEIELNEQLRSISKTISDLESRNIPIPDELRNLKTNLVTQLSNIEDRTKLQNYFYTEIKSILGIKAQKKSTVIKNPKTSRDHSLTSIQLPELLSLGLITPGTKIVHYSKDITHYGVITKSGKVEIKVNNDIKSFDSPSGAADYITGTSNNGWIWWSAIINGREIKLNVLREQYYSKVK